jgi:MoaA/NifB/PqqE/SkfB family radical SAM enzyme
LEPVEHKNRVLQELAAKYDALPDGHEATAEVAERLSVLYGQIGRGEGHRRFQLEALKTRNRRVFQEAMADKPATCRHKPLRVEFYVLNWCNARCIMCGSPTKGQTIDFDRFQRVTEAVLPTARECLLIGGEVLLLPNFYEMSRQVHEHGIRLSLTSNLFSLEGRRAEAIREFYKELRVSVDGATKATYESIRTGLHFERLVRNLDVLAEIKAISGLWVGLEFVAMRRNITELPAVVEMASQYGFDHVGATFVQVRERVGFEESLLFHRELANRHLDLARARARDLRMDLCVPRNFDLEHKPYWRPDAATEGYRKCVVPWERMRVFPDGRVIPCCHLDLPVGNIFEATLEEVWNGRVYQSLREALREGRADMPERCKHCPFVGRKTDSNDAALHVDGSQRSAEEMQRRLNETYPHPPHVVTCGPAEDRLPAGQPKVSIVTACYNCAQYLPECVDSISHQTMPEWELFLLDDGSQDGTRRMIEEYSRRDPRIKPFYFPDNAGPYVRRNFAIQRAGSEFIVIQDADDLMSPHKLEVLYGTITQDPQLAAVGSWYRDFLHEFRGLHYTDCKELPLEQEEIVEKFTTWRYAMTHMSAILRKEMFEIIGWYDGNPFASDAFWFAKLGEYARYRPGVHLKNVAEYLTLKRVHTGNQTTVLPTIDPRNRRIRYHQYCEVKLRRIREKMQAVPGTDLAAELRHCDCSDFLVRFKAHIIKWESEPLDEKVIPGLLRHGVWLFNKTFYVSCVGMLGSIELMEPGILRRCRNYDLLRAMALFALDRKDESRRYLEREIENHDSVAARRFLSECLDDDAPRDVQNWCAQNAGACDLQFIDATEGVVMFR